MKKIAITFILFFTFVFCFCQDIQYQIDTTNVVIEDESAVIIDDYISIHGKIYTVAISNEEYLFMVSKKDLDHELGSILERIEKHPKDIETTIPIFASFWDPGTKLYKIKQIDESYYIAVEWPDLVSGSKYYVYCHKENENAKNQLKKLYEILLKK